MSTKRKKLGMIGFWLIVLLFTIGCLLSNRSPYPNSLSPTRIVKMTIKESQRDTLFEQLHSFSEENDFQYEITDFRYEGEYFYKFWMFRDNVEITVGNVPPEPTLVYIAFYWIDFWSPADEDAINDLLDDLMRYISEVPDMKVLEVK